MIVRFESSETGELLMFAETARVLLTLVGKETTARGVFTAAEMLPAAETLKAAIDADLRRRRAEEAALDEDGEKSPQEPVIALSQRAWPLMDMLVRTAGSGVDAHILWEAASDF